MGESGGLALIKRLVASGDHRYSEKVHEALEDYYFSPEDIECCICSGYVYKIKKDRHKNSIGNKVYIIKGKDSHGYDFYTQGKIMRGAQGKIYFLITAHR